MSMKAVRALGAFAAVVTVGGVAAGPAGASFDAPSDLSPPGLNASEPDVAIAANGDAVFTWLVNDGSDTRVQARALSAAGVLSQRQTLSPAGLDADDPQVAVDPDGNAVFVWTLNTPVFQRIQAIARTSAGVLSDTQNVSPGNQPGTSADVALDNTGDAVISWQLLDGSTNRIQARGRSAAGVLSPRGFISRPGEDAFNAPGQLAVDADGDAVFTWGRSDGTNQRIQARARTAAGVIGPVRNLSRAGENARFPQVAIEPTSGDSIVTWQRSDGTNTRVQARTRSAAGALGSVQNLSEPGQNASFPVVGVTPNGRSVFAWQRSDGTNTRIQTRARNAAGVLSPVQTVSAAGQNASEPAIGVDGSADAVLAWLQPVPPFTVVQARERTAAGDLQATQIVSQDGQSASTSGLDVNPAGAAATVWERSDGTDTRVQGSIGP
jgi:hypothetical protein